MQFSQAHEINELVGKAFKASFTKKSLKRHKQKVKDTPWRVVNHQQPPPQPQPQPIVTDNQPLPSAPLPTAPPLSPPSTHNRDYLLYEAGDLEADIGRLRARIADIETQMRELAGVEDAVLQLAVQLSTLQQQLELKSRRLMIVRQELQILPAESPPPSYEGLYPTMLTEDVSSISLEDAEWFQEGLPR